MKKTTKERKLALGRLAPEKRQQEPLLARREKSSTIRKARCLKIRPDRTIAKRHPLKRKTAPATTEVQTSDTDRGAPQLSGNAVLASNDDIFAVIRQPEITVALRL